MVTVLCVVLIARLVAKAGTALDGARDNKRKRIHGAVCNNIWKTTLGIVCDIILQNTCL